MRSREFVTELGDSPAEHEPNRRRRRSLFHATVDGQWVDVFFDRSDLNGTLHITFTVNNNYDAPDQPTRASGSTVRILSTVLDIIRQRLPEYIRSARPPAVSFTAREHGRARLYRKYFVPVIQNILGPRWELNEYPSMGMTVFNWRPAKKQDVGENFEDDRPVIDMLEEGCIELSRMLEERPHLIENYEGWREIQSLLGRVVGEEPVIGQRYSVLNLIITPPGRFLMQQGVKTPVKLTNILDRGSYVQYEFDVSGRIFRFPEDNRAGDRLSRTFLYSTPQELEKTQSFIAMSLRDWEIRDRVNENFADGRNPGRKGLSKRVGVSQKMSISKLKKIASTATGERRRMAQWNLNMKRGRQKNK